MPKWFIYCTIAMLNFGIWTLVARVAMDDLSPYAQQVAAASGGSAASATDAEELKRLADKQATYMMQILSGIGILPFALPLLFSKRLTRGTNFRRGIFFASCCGVFTCIGNMGVYLAVAENGPMSIVYPMTAMPLLQVLVAPYLFHERLSAAQIVGIVIAMVAIALLNTDPTSQIAGVKLVAPWMFFALIGLLSYGVSMTTQKAATYHISDELSTLVYSVAFLGFAGILLAADSNLVAMLKLLPFHKMLSSMAIGLTMGFGTLMLYAAYRHGKAAVVSPYVSMYPLITVLVAVPVWNESLGWVRGIGVGCALLAGILLGLEKSQPATAAASPV